MACKLMLNFIKDIDGDIDRFVEQYLDNHDSVPDIDTYSQTLRECQQCVYSRKLPNGELFDLKIGNNPRYDYLYWFSENYYGNDLDKSRFASDSIVNMQERYTRNPETDFIPDLTDKNIRDKMIDYVKSASTIGGEIMFPKHPNSVNVARGRNPKIKDRFDLTLECIRRFYEKKDKKEKEYNPLYDALKADEKFFDLFVDFNGYVKFFFLEPYVKEDGTIKFFIGGDKFQNGVDFNEDFNPFPTSQEEWEQLYQNQKDRLQERNKLICEKMAECPIPAK